MPLELSTEQRDCAERATRGKSCVVQACCGAGKTRVLLGAAHEDPDAKVLILSFNKALAAETAAKVADAPNIEVHNIHKFASMAYGVTVPDNRTLQKVVDREMPLSADYLDYDLICIDEIQDVFTAMTCFLAELIRRQRKAPDLLLVGDDAQRLYQFMHGEAASLFHGYRALDGGGGGERRGWTTKTLSKTQRLTPEIVRFVNRFFRQPGHPPLVSAKPEGTGPLPEVVIGYERELLSVVTQLLTQYRPGDLMILSGSLRNKLTAVIEAHLVRKRVAVYNTMYPPSEDDNGADGKVILSSFHRSKGLERPVVLVVQLSGYQWLMDKRPGGLDSPECTPPAHVAVTRAMRKLVLFTYPFSGLYPTIPSLDALEGYATVRKFRDPKPLADLVARDDERRAEAEAKEPSSLTTLIYEDFKTWVPDAELHAFADRVKRVDALSGWWGGDVADWGIPETDEPEQELAKVVDDSVLCTALTLLLTDFNCDAMRLVAENVDAGRQHSLRYSHPHWVTLLYGFKLPWTGPKTATTAMEIALMHDARHALFVGGVGTRMHEWSARDGEQRSMVCKGLRTIAQRLKSELKGTSVVANARVVNETDQVAGSIDLLSDGVPVVFTTSNDSHLSEAVLRRIWWNHTLMPGVQTRCFFTQSYTMYSYRVE